MTPPATVRPATEADLPAVKALFDAHRRELGFTPRPALATAIQRGWLLVAETGPAATAEAGPAVEHQPTAEARSGRARGGRPRPGSAAPGPAGLVGAASWWARRDGVVVLYSIAVAEPARRQGAGRALLTALIHWARAHGAHTLTLKCPAELPANAFYARLGLHLVAGEPGRRRPLHRWTLDLTGPTAPPATAPG